jgi:hypothetical protein
MKSSGLSFDDVGAFSGTWWKSVLASGCSLFLVVAARGWQPLIGVTLDCNS